MSALIEHLHAVHVKRGLFVPECLLCVEARQKAEKARPAWIGHPRALDPWSPA